MQIVLSSFPADKPLAQISDTDVPVVCSGSGKKITHLYRYGSPRSWYQLTYRKKRVVEGLAYYLYAARCVELCGLPHGVVKRAEHVR